MSRGSVHVDARMAPDWKAQLGTRLAFMLEQQVGPRVVARARQLVPVDSGELRATIRSRVTIGRDGIPQLTVGAGTPKPGPGYYALFVELGTRLRARPYLRPALFESGQR